jgi:hypothetical protein
MSTLLEALRPAFFTIPDADTGDGPAHGPSLADVLRLADGSTTWQPPGWEGSEPVAIACWSAGAIYLLIWHTKIGHGDHVGPDRYWVAAHTWISDRADPRRPCEALEDLEVSQSIHNPDPRMFAWWFGVVEIVLMEWAARQV